MTVEIDGARFTPSDDALLGEGGEGRVYRLGEGALKLFFTPSALRARKLEAFPSGLPREVVAPLRLARDPASGAVAGYVMRLVDGGFDAGHLGERRFRERERVTNGHVVRWVLSMAKLLADLHARGVVVGDLNSGNVMLTHGAGRELESHLIDADSMQHAQFPCLVAHERYVHPSLYRRDLAKEPWFSPKTDLYALAVLAFESLLYVHPYGGVHPDHPTLVRRAEARVSVLDAGVKRPHAAARPDTLDDDWLEYFSAVFEHDTIGPPPPSLGGTRFVRCTACGVEHARRACPSCSRRSVAPLALARTPDHLDAQVVHDGGDAPVVGAGIAGGELVYAFARDGRLVREGGFSMPMPTGRLRIDLERRATWVVTADGAIRYDHDGAVERIGSTDPRGREAFATAGDEVLRVRDGVIERVRRGTRVGAVFAGRTALFSGESLSFAFYRAGALGLGFLFSPASGGLRQVALPTLVGRTTRTFAHFDDDHVLFGVSLDDGRGIVCRLHMFDRAGKLLAFVEGPPDSSPLLAEARSGTLARGLFAVPSAEGVRLYRPEGGTLREVRSFADTAPWMEGSPELHVDGRGALYAVQFARIVRLTLT